MDLMMWLRARGGIGHRDDASDAGFTPPRVRAEIRSGSVRRVRSKWIALPDAPAELVRAAEAGGAVTCVSLARRREWWVPPEADGLLHLQLPGHASIRDDGLQAHWAKPLGPPRPRELEVCVEDALAHAAQCFALDQATAIWESAIRQDAISLDSLRQVCWRSTAARRVAEHVRDDTGSSLETIFHVRLSGWGVRLRFQVHLAGHDVDFLIGTHLVIQIDGWAYHSSSADRTRDIAHDAELRLRGYTVLRFSYAQIMYDWPGVERILIAAISRGAHLAPSPQ
jgi:very-short-patch-repair endonuclease